MLVEALTLDLFSHAILGDAHFEPRRGGILLNAAGRGKFLLQYERRMEREFMGEQAGHRTSLRAQIEAGVVRMKSALLGAANEVAPDAFEGFLMN